MAHFEFAVPAASTPHESTPAVDALTSHDAEFRFSIASDEDVAFPASKVVMVPEAMVVKPFAVTVLEKMFALVNVLLEYIFGMVVLASMKLMAEVVEKARPTEEK